MRGLALVTGLAAVYLVQGDCKWETKKGSTTYNYDLSTLTRSGAQRDFHDNNTEYDYEMNVCAPVNIGGRCTQENATLCQLPISRMGGMENAYILARDYAGVNRTWALLDETNPQKGVKMMYSNGDECSDGVKRNVTMEFHCDSSATTAADFTDLTFTETETCIYVTSLHSRNACPIEHTAYIPLTSGVPRENESLEAGAWKYYKISVDDSAAQLVLELEDYADGDPDIYVKKEIKPLRDDFEYRGSSSNEYERLSITYEAENNPLTVGTYVIGVFAYGSKNATYTVKATVETCVNKCNGHGRCINRKCFCYEDWTSPTEVRDCTAQVRDIADGELVSTELNYIETWSYFRIEVTEERFEMVVSANVEFPESKQPGQTTSSMAGMYVRKDDFPTRETHDGYDTMWSYNDDDHLQVRLDASLLTPGTWIVGLYRQQTSKSPFKFELLATLNDCPQGCSGHGKCNVADHTCTCDENYRTPLPGGFSEDCSLSDKELHPGIPVDNLQIKSYETMYFHVNVPKKIAEGEVELVVQTRQIEEIYPILYMSWEKAPTREDADFVSPGKNTTIITLSPSELKNGTWYVGLYNGNYKLLNITTLSVYYSGRCLNDCSGHGSCDTLKGAKCSCNEGWAGGDCSVDLSEYEEDEDERRGGVGGGTVFLLIVMFFGLGLVGGVYAKKKKPDLWADPEDIPASSATGDQYNIEDHMNMTLGADYISMQQDQEEETR